MIIQIFFNEVLLYVIDNQYFVKLLDTIIFVKSEKAEYEHEDNTIIVTKDSKVYSTKYG